MKDSMSKALLAAAVLTLAGCVNPPPPVAPNLTRAIFVELVPDEDMIASGHTMPGQHGLLPRAYTGCSIALGRRFCVIHLPMSADLPSPESISEWQYEIRNAQGHGGDYP